MARRSLGDLPDWCYDLAKKEFSYCGSGWWPRRTELELFYRAVQAEWSTLDMMVVDDAVQKGGVFSTASPTQIPLLNGWSVREIDLAKLKSRRASLLASNTPGARVLVDARKEHRTTILLSILLSVASIFIAIVLYLLR